MSTFPTLCNLSNFSMTTISVIFVILQRCMCVLIHRLTGRQTDTHTPKHTDSTEIITYPHARMEITLDRISYFLLSICLSSFYRPLRKFAKVMFLHLSASHSVHRGRCLPQCMLGYTPVLPPHQTRGRPPRKQTPPCSVHAGRYGQQAGGTHPTGCILVDKTLISHDNE